MKAFLSLLVITLSLGTALSLHLRPETLLYLPLYALAVFHIFRLNISEGFFLVFLEKTQKEDAARIRLGPSEIEMKDEADRNEDKFLSLFDWKKSTVRKILSWSVFCTAIYILFFRVRLEINAENVMPAVTALFLMRVVAIGHLLVPLAINLLFVLKDIPDYKLSEWPLVAVYGILFIANLSLIFPSEDRMGRKLKDWMSGKWLEFARAALIILLTFTAGLFIFPDKFAERRPLEVPQLEIDRSDKNLRHLESSLRNLLGNGLMKKDALSLEARALHRDINEFNRKENRSPEEWKNIRERQEKLTQKFNEALTLSATPSLSPELLEKMKSDLRGRTEKGIDPQTFEKMQELLTRMDNFKGGSGDDLVAGYRDLKFGKGGYYNEETEMDAGGSPDERAQEILKKMSESVRKKQEVSELINKNIEALKSSPGEGLEAVNDALKKDFAEADTFSEAEKEAVTQELRRSKDEQAGLLRKTSDPELAQKLGKLLEENERLLNQMSPHMNARDKSALAEKILHQKEETSALKNRVRDEVAEKLRNREEIRKKQDEEKAEKGNKFFEKFLRIASIAAIVLLVFWFMRLFRKKGVRKVRGIPEEVKEDIRERLLEVKKKKLSPREEVIETYNVFHDGLHALVFTRETPPSCIVYEGLSVAEPELKDPTFTVTDTFARTFYGDRDVTKEDLKAFRKDVKKVFKFFEIAI